MRKRTNGGKTKHRLTWKSRPVGKMIVDDNKTRVNTLIKMH